MTLNGDSNFRRFSQGEVGQEFLSASRLNAGFDLADRVRDHVNRLPRATDLDGRRVVETWIGKIVSAGPRSQANYTDCRYWVERRRIKATATGSGIAETEKEVSTATPDIVTATNKSEEAAGTHTLTADTEVMVLALVGSDKNQTPFYVFWYAPSGMISGLVTSDASGKGKYNGKSFTDRTTDVLATGDLAESDFGGLSSTEDCLILNPVELGSSTTGHDVTATANKDKFAIYFTGRLARVNSDGKKVIHAMLFYVGCTEA
jgi:hypothetical protein